MTKLTQRFPLIFGLLVAGLLLLITSQFIVSMKQIQQVTQSQITTDVIRVALLLEGPTYDQGWNSSALESLRELQKKYGFSLEIANNLTSEQITTVARAYAANDYDLIFGHGVIFSNPFTAIAPYYPNTRFVSFNGEAIHPNQTTIRYDMKPAGYIVGKLAALMSKNHKVGYIVTDKPTEYAQVEGFKQGASETDETTLVEVAKVPDFNDVTSAIKAVHELIDKGVDVIYTTGDSYNLAVITEAQRANIFAVGYIADQRYIAPNHVLASLIQDVGQVYRTLAAQYFQYNLPAGTVTYGIPEGVNYLSPMGMMVPPKVQDQINQDLRNLGGK